ncbi:MULTISPECIES: hypothetical protein [Pseudomonas]|jgi:hypothetical protein|uniref:Uncharacterized protein n=3 Tax=Pseudomonas simiae TaxID=321846 RepID=A0ABS9G3H8_9PSED|nr:MULTISPECIES: hypothetical protein [Pseudomonas]MBD8738315.1 hypothetical protein [Pseudomonas fluorescens]AJZ97177.1 hypothetical protein PFLUOLIPICF7_17350 [Pseudomonas simiae]KIQ08643.1 hypothetical protein RU03_19910 [Pseudomonas simiae]MCF5290127.1 hypothetical protein [Pseudomonas simiae]MCF5318160.1 hypothetical protein [Pseudomonas simiae]
MKEKLNLACNIKLMEQDEKYRDIRNYIFFHSLSDAVWRNHQVLTSDLAELLDLTASTDTQTIFAKRTRVQNSLLNLLNAHKLFIDILKRHHEKNEKRRYRQLRLILGYYYDEDFNYRIFEVLRNYCQHFSSVPIDIFSDFEGVSYIFINKQELGKDAKAKNKIERELASPLHMELNSAVRDWLVVVTHIYGLVLDFFAYKSSLHVCDFLQQLETDVAKSRSEPLVAEVMKSVEIKIIKKRMLFPVLPDPEQLCRGILERIGSAEQRLRYESAKTIISDLRSSKNYARKRKGFGIDFESKGLDTLTLKQLNRWLNGEDPI